MGINYFLKIRQLVNISFIINISLTSIVDLQDMLYDFMKQIISRLDSIENKVDANKQNVERIVRKMEKRKVSTMVTVPLLPITCIT